MVKYVWPLALVVVLSGCGMAGEPEAAEKIHAYAVEVPLSEWQLVVDRRTLKGPSQTAIVPPGDVTFKVRNTGHEPHAFTIKGPKVDARTRTLAPGESEPITVRLAPGMYEVGCPEGDHRERGMVGRVRAQ